MKDISIGLGLRDDVLGDEIFTDCMLMVATQYILIAGEAVRSRFAEEEEEQGSSTRLNQHLWKLWTERLQEASISEYVKAETMTSAIKAHEKMIALWPEDLSDAALQIRQGAEVPRA